MRKISLFLLIVFLSQVTLLAQEVPEWVQKKPEPANDTYLYVVERGVGATEMEARNRAMGLVYRSTIERLALPINVASINNAISSGSTYGENAKMMNVPVNKVCEYIQPESKQYAVYVLCQVARYGNIRVQFTEFTHCNQFFSNQVSLPAWCNDEWRANNYPRELYLQGFIVGEQQAGESIEQVHQRAKEKAQAEAIGGIMPISECQNLSIESWHNPKTNEVFAFAWVKKTDLVRTLNKQIISHITRAEMAVEEAEGLLAEGEKGTAHKALEKATRYLQQVEEIQQRVQRVDANTEMEDMAFAESNALKQRASALSQQLKNGVTVYVGGDVSILDKSYPTFVQQIKQEISPIGCTFVANEKEADWVIRLHGTTQEYNTIQTDSYNAFVVITTVEIEIAKKGQIIYSGNVSKKVVHTMSIELAAQEAYSEARKEIAAQISEIINN
jgi:hypothetical protein